jgi:azurin
MKPRNFVALFIAALAALLLHAADSAAPRVIKLRGGVDNAIKFDVSAITAAPGETITILLTNASALPKAVMGHNWVLLAKGTDPTAFANSGVSEVDHDYISSKQQDKVIASIHVLGPGETGEATFQAPGEPGDYPFVCCFPGHCQIGMKGTLTIRK